MIRSRHLAVVAALGTSCLWGAAGCSSSDAPSGTTATAGASTSGSAGAANNTAGTSGGTVNGGSTGVAGLSSSGAPAAGAPSGGSSGAGTAGAAGSAGSSASGGSSGAGTTGGAGMLGLGGGTHTMPTCAKNTPEPNPTRGSECDYLLQSLDFEDTLSYPTTLSQIKTTTFGQAFGLFAINSCSPYCYSKNLTVGVDIVGGNTAQTQGEIIVEFPAAGGGLPITAADMNRNILAWITFDGAAKPPFEIDTQLIIETTTAVVASKETKAFFKPAGNLNPFGPFNVANNYSYGNGSEFKYFNAVTANGFPDAPMNVTGMGFRIVAKATAGQEWHGVAYIDHLQIRAGSPANPPGQYPYGLN